MKKLLILTRPMAISVISLLILSSFLRYYLAINSQQLLKEFKNQNFREIYSMDTLKLSSRMNALSSVINWVCINGEVDSKSFYKMERGSCKNGIFQQQQTLLIPQANNIKISFTTRLPKEVEQLFLLFLGMQTLLIITLIISTKKAEEEKRTNEIRINKMARQMSHDIRSPLATFNTVISNLKSIPTEDLILLKKSIKRISEISDTLLTQSKSEVLLSAQIKPSEISLVLKEIIDEKKIELAPNPKINICLNQISHSLFVDLNEIEFKRIISNLINNSVEAIKGSEVKIDVSIKKENDSAIITVIDNGMGISADILSKLGMKELTTKTKGSGLGLTHCREKVKEWNGNFNIESTPNAGTKVEIKLPLNKEIKKTSILIDDDELVKLTWASAAKKQNVELLTFSQREELLNSLEMLSKDVVFYIDSDLGNGFKGEDLAQELHQKGFENLYMATGYSDEAFAHLKFLRGVLSKTPPWK